MPSSEEETARIDSSRIGRQRRSSSGVAKPNSQFVIVGLYADKHGRKAALIIMITLMAFGTGLLGLLPTYGAIGITDIRAARCVKLMPDGSRRDLDTCSAMVSVNIGSWCAAAGSPSSSW